MLLLLSLLLVSPSAAAAPWSTSLEDLDPAFAERAGRVVEALRGQGWDPLPSCTWRSPELQDLLVSVGNATRAKGGESCHNPSRDGKPSARAIDLWNGGINMGLLIGEENALLEQVPFLVALGVAAKAEGLGWGGDWRGQTSAWSRHGLGWDPAHIEAPPCR